VHDPTINLFALPLRALLARTLSVASAHFDVFSSLPHHPPFLHPLSHKDTPGAIKKLTEYLDKFAADAEGWTELGSLYLKDSRFECAKFCYEELILTNPYNHLFHQRYAEVRAHTHTHTHTHTLYVVITRAGVPGTNLQDSTVLAHASAGLLRRTVTAPRALLLNVCVCVCVRVCVCVCVCV
jgi:tetratricopeptide (TPR) repeat protein